MAESCPNADRCDEWTCGCPPEVVAFRVQLGIGDGEPIEGELLDTPEGELPTPTAEHAFTLGMAVGRSVRDAEDAAAAVFRRARRRRLVLDAVAVGVGWFLGSWIAEQVQP